MPLAPCDRRGADIRRGFPMSPLDPYPCPKPPPGKPIWPSIAASTRPSQTGCSPCSARCSDQLTVIIVRPAAICRASARIRSAAMPVRAAAHSGVFGTPSPSPRR
jgi:hypothetical protein